MSIRERELTWYGITTARVSEKPQNRGLKPAPTNRVSISVRAGDCAPGAMETLTRQTGLSRSD